MNRKSNDQRETALMALVARYERAAQGGDTLFLAEEEFEELLVHYFGIHDYDQTLEVADLAISQHNYTPDFYKWKALIHKINLEEEDAMATLEQLNIYAPNDEEVMMLRLEVYVHFEHQEEARAALDQLYNVVDQDEKLSLLAFFDGLLCMQENRFRESFEALAEAIRLDPYQEPAYDELLNAPELSAMRKEIGKLLKRQADRDPFNDLTWFYLGLWYDDGGNDMEALEAFGNARSLNDARSAYDLEYADKLFDLEMYEPALTAYQAYFESEEAEESYETCMRIGRSHQMLDDYTSAKKSYFRALEIDPEMYDIYQYIAECCVAEEKWGVAAYNYGRAVELPNHTADCWLGLALCSSATNSPLDAEQAFLKAIEMDEQFSDAYISYALFLVELGREADALQLLADTATVYRDSALLFGTVAILMITSRRQQALALLNEGLAEFYEDHELLFNWHPDLEQDRDIMALLHLHKD
ncbi:tetratricopeptide (TPR) repeat protein [Lewinella aquimaris]|uniref:Tetratricopeptide (TPR) repeat protein n=1 Tax=Neolewinella aquimaris TaxID=1835722 RepID=A0A840E5Y8_9BACT|nr:hypothetical protein [Neolewinella aquimaris]MBB4078597.1 tetratricopeptide (TPR) repeat protein [Neolewinella aquimaris]